MTEEELLARIQQLEEAGEGMRKEISWWRKAYEKVTKDAAEQLDQSLQLRDQLALRCSELEQQLAATKRKTPVRRRVTKKAS